MDARSRFARRRTDGGGPEPSDATRRLGDLRRSQPTDVTLKNLLALLTTKLELCARLPVCAWEAGDEGHEGCADSLLALADAERSSCQEVLECLRTHLDQTVGSRS
jgi:hypothetical protein